MPNNAPIAILDGKSTPVSHTFSPDGFDANGVSVFKERIAGAAIGFPSITWNIRAPLKGGASTYKVTAKLSIPKVITTTDSTGKSVTSVDYTELATVEMTHASFASDQERKDLRVMCANMLLNATFATSADNLERFW